MTTLSRTGAADTTGLATRTPLAPARATRPGPRLTANLFGISFGVAGLAEAWNAAAPLGVPTQVADVLWATTALVWGLTGVGYLRELVRTDRWRTELADPTFGPFVALVTIVPMLLGVALAEHTRTAGVTLFAVGLVTTVALGGWLTGQWILATITLPQWHPGYFLPTVAGGLLASSCASALGNHAVAELMFGYGMICWVLLGSILLQLLLTKPTLPTPLLPTMAIEMAPPVVAGVAWFGLNGGRPDLPAYALAGYAGLMALVQLRLLPAYRSVPFGPSWWAFAFSYVAVFVDALHWLTAVHTAHASTWAVLLLTVSSAALLALVLRTAVSLARGAFLPPPNTSATKEA